MYLRGKWSGRLMGQIEFEVPKQPSPPSRATFCIQLLSVLSDGTSQLLGLLAQERSVRSFEGFRDEVQT